MCLRRQEIGVQNVPELVSKHTKNYLVSVFASFRLRNEGMTCIDLDRHIIGSRKERVLGIPINVDTDAPVIVIPACLCSC